MTADKVANLADIYVTDADFRDPFNHVQGIDGIRTVYADMFESLQTPKFTVLESQSSQQSDHNSVFLVWDMHYLFNSDAAEQTPRRRIHGCSHLKLNEAGKITYHRDYWDAAEELYTQLPVIGRVMHWLRRRVSATE